MDNLDPIWNLWVRRLKAESCLGLLKRFETFFVRFEEHPYPEGNHHTPLQALRTTEKADYVVYHEMMGQKVHRFIEGMVRKFAKHYPWNTECKSQQNIGTAISERDLPYIKTTCGSASSDIHFLGYTTRPRSLTSKLIVTL